MKSLALLVLFMGSLSQAKDLVLPEKPFTCYPSSLNQGYPDDGLPAVDKMIFSKSKIQISLQFFGQNPVRWEYANSQHGYIKEITYNAHGKVDRVVVFFEDENNSGLINEETQYEGEFHCPEWANP